MRKILLFSFIAILLVGTLSFVCMPTIVHAEEAGQSVASKAASAVAGTIFGFLKIEDFIQFALAWVLNIVIRIVGLLLWITGILFNISMYFTLNISEFVTKIPVVNVGWTVFRDLANMGFIFILLYIAIETILQGGSFQTKTLVRNVIIVAVFINFSLFFTKVIIDSSNILALGFYNRIAPIEVKMTDPTTWAGGIPTQFMNALRLQTYASTDGIQSVGISGLANTTAGTLGNIAQNYLKIITISVFAIIVILITSFVFLAATVLFTIRLIVLIVLMILSPMAFVSWILPGTKSYTSKWWNYLLSQSFFAPAYMIMIYITLKTINHPAFAQLMTLNQGTKTLAQAFSGSTMDSVAIIFNFILVIGLSIASLLVAKELGARGSSTVVGWGQKLQGATQSFVGRSTLGRLGSSLDKKIGNTQFGRSAFGSSVREVTTGALTKATFGGKESFKTTKENREKEIESYIKKNTDKPDKVISYVRELSGDERNHAYKNLSPKLRAQVDEGLKSVPGNKATGLGTITRGIIPVLGQPARPSGATIVSEQQSKLGSEEREKTIAAHLKEHQGEPAEIAKYINDLTKESEQLIAYEKLSAKDRASLEEEFKKLPPTIPGGKKSGADLSKTLKTLLSPEERAKTIGAIIKEYKDPVETASFIQSLPPESQESAVNELTPKDRAIVFAELVKSNLALGPGLVISLKNYLSPDERDKTEKEIIKLAKDNITETTEKILNEIRTGLSVSGASLASGITADDGTGTGRTKTYRESDVGDLIKNIAPKDLKEYKAENLKVIAHLLNKKQFEVAVEKNDEIGSFEQGEIKKLRKDAILKVWQAKTAANTEAEIKGMGPKDIAELDNDVLQLPDVIKHLTPSDLEALKGSNTNGKTRQKIAEEIKKYGRGQVHGLHPQTGSTHPAYDYITAGPGKDLWK